MTLSINEKRFLSRLEDMSRFNRTPGEGVTRFSYSPEDRRAREYLLSLFEEAGMAVSVDGVGNIRARLEGSDPSAPAVLSGSHIDTVLHGGRYDGTVGTLGALEAVTAIAESGLPHGAPLEVVAFAEEEGSNFGSTLAGSKAMVGKYTLEDMKHLTTPEGKTMEALVREAGYDPDSLAGCPFRPEKVKALVELHIEQSVVLESLSVPLGIVEAVSGIRVVEVRLKGTSNHAGATPMPLRQDPLAAAARIIGQVEVFARGSGTGTTVATVGKISCSPNVSNIIPAEVRFTMETRDVATEGMESVTERLASFASAVAAAGGVEIEIIPVSDSDPVVLDEEIVGLIDRCAEKRGFSRHRMNSGAVHDACMFAPLLPTGMIFVPSRGGRSHVPEEHTDPADLVRGVTLLADVLYELAR